MKNEFSRSVLWLSLHAVQRFCFAKPPTIPQKGSFRYAKATVINMNQQISVTPKKPFPLAGVFLLIYAVPQLIYSVYTIFNHYQTADTIFNVAICIGAAIVAIILLAKKSGVALTVSLGIFTLITTVYFIFSTINSYGYFVWQIRWILEIIDYDSPIHLISDIMFLLSDLSYINQNFLVALILLIITVISIFSVNPRKCKSFVLKLGGIPIVLSVLMFLSAGTNLICWATGMLLEGYGFDIQTLLSITFSHLPDLPQFLAFLFLSLWFGRLAKYRRKLMAYEASTPITTFATEIPTAPSHINNSTNMFVAPAASTVVTAPFPEQATNAEAEARAKAEAEARAKAEAEARAQAEAASISNSTIGEIQRLKQLLDSGAITEEEFALLKKKLIEE